MRQWLYFPGATGDGLNKYCILCTFYTLDFQRTVLMGHTWLEQAAQQDTPHELSTVPPVVSAGSVNFLLPTFRASRLLYLACREVLASSPQHHRPQTRAYTYGKLRLPIIESI